MTSVTRVWGRDFASANLFKLKSEMRRYGIKKSGSKEKRIF